MLHQTHQQGRPLFLFLSQQPGWPPTCVFCPFSRNLFSLLCLVLLTSLIFPRHLSCIWLISQSLLSEFFSIFLFMKPCQWCRSWYFLELYMTGCAVNRKRLAGMFFLHFVEFELCLSYWTFDENNNIVSFIWNSQVTLHITIYVESVSASLMTLLLCYSLQIMAEVWCGNIKLKRVKLFHSCC